MVKGTKRPFGQGLLAVLFLFISVYGLSGYIDAYLKDPVPMLVGHPAAELFASTERPIYSPNETVRVQGLLTEEEAPLMIKVSDSGKGIVWLDQVVSERDGSFQSAFRLRPDATLGRYEVQVSYGGQRSTSYFDVREGPSGLYSAISLRANGDRGLLLIKGRLSPSMSADIHLEYSEPSSSWKPLATVRSDEGGDFEYLWRFPTCGPYGIRALWMGDDRHRAASSSIITSGGPPCAALPGIAAFAPIPGGVSLGGAGRG